MVTLRCTILRSNPPRLTDIRWFRNGDFIRMPMPDLKETPELKFKLEPTNNGSYECRVSNTEGTSACTFNVSGECAINGKKVGILLLSVLYSCTHAPLPPYKDLFFLLCHSVIFIKHCCSISLSVIQHNHTMLSFTLIHPTLSGFWKETTIPTICSGHKKNLMPQIAS